MKAIFTNLWMCSAAAWKRFPVATIFALLWTVGAVYLLNDNYTSIADIVSYVVFASTLGVIVSIALDLRFEAIGSESKWLARAWSLLIAAVAFYYFYSPYFNIDVGVDVLRFMLLVAVSLLFLAVSPYIFVKRKSKVDPNKYVWHYVVTLAGAAISAFVYVLIVFLGIALLLGSMEYLFDLMLDGYLYAEIWLVLMGLGFTTFFMVLIPEKFNFYDAKSPVTKSLSLLSKYVAIPLVVLYMAVLYVFGIGLLVRWQMPLEEEAAWFLVFALLGALTYFVASYADIKKEDGAVKKFVKYFPWLILPLLSVLYLAAWDNIMGWNYSKDTYFVLLFADWLVLMAFYFGISKRKKLVVPFVTLGLFLLIAGFGGPLGVEAMTEDYDPGVERGEFEYQYQSNYKGYYETYNDSDQVLDVAGYDYLVHFYSWMSNADANIIILDDLQYQIATEGTTLVVSDLLGEVVWTADMAFFLQEYEAGELEPEQLTFPLNGNDLFEIKVSLERLEFYAASDGQFDEVSSMEGFLFVKRK